MPFLIIVAGLLCWAFSGWRVLEAFVQSPMAFAAGVVIAAFWMVMERKESK